MVNAMGPYNGVLEPVAEKVARIDDIGGPDTHANFPWGWAMAANTPLKRYKQNTHGGGIRDPLVVSWPAGIAARGGLRHGFRHACDVVPTLLEVVGAEPPETIAGVAQQPLEGVSFAASFGDADPPRGRPQYFEMFGHRGLWKDGWKAVSYHPPGTPFEDDVWELYHLETDFSEIDDIAGGRPDKLAELISDWWVEAERCKVLPLDDRFAPRFAENAARFHGPRTRFVFHAGMGHLPTDVAPDVRSRAFVIEADVVIGGRRRGRPDRPWRRHLRLFLVRPKRSAGLRHECRRQARHHDQRPGGPGRPSSAGRRREERREAIIPSTDRWRGSRRGRDHHGLQQLHLLVGSGHRMRPWQSGGGLCRAVRLHRHAEEGDCHDGRRPGPRRRGESAGPRWRGSRRRSDEDRRSSCHCGFITFEADADPARTGMCNCTDCQALTGAAVPGDHRGRPGHLPPARRASPRST